MHEFKFHEKTHTYFLDGEPMTGVTTVLSVINKPALVQWAANCACDYIEEKVKEAGWQVITTEYLDTLVKEARTAHNRKRDKAADEGKIAHKCCEIWIADGSTPDTVEIDGVTYQVTPRIAAMRDSFIAWATTNAVKFTASEKRVYSVKHFTAGTLDFACEIDGVKYIGDIKTTSGIYDRTPFAQTAAYQMMWAEMEGKEPGEIVDRRIIVNLKKDKPFDPEKDVYVSTFYEDDIELFMSALTMYRNVGRFAPMSYQATKH